MLQFHLEFGYLQNGQVLLYLFCSAELSFIISEVFVDGDCAKASSVMLSFDKKLSSCIDNDDSIVIINTNPINNVAQVYL
jgi:hypothetical protein